MYGPFRSSYPPSSQHGERKNPLRLSNYLGYERAIRPSPEKIFPPFLERILRIAVTCSFVKEGGRGRERKEERKEGKKGVRKRASSKGERTRRRGDGSEREEKRGGRHCFPEWAAKERRRVRGTVCL